MALSKSPIEAYDLQTDYVWQTAYGEFKASVMGTVQPHLQQQVLEGLPVLEQVGYNLGPLRVRGNIGLTWRRNDWSLGWNMQYYHSYLIYQTSRTDEQNAGYALRNGSPVIPSQNYHDIYGSYRFDDRSGSRWSGLLSNVEILMSIKNVLDTEPALVTDDGQGYFSASPYGDPRLRSYAITLSKSFQ